METKLTDFPLEHLAYLEATIKADYKLLVRRSVELESRFNDHVALHNAPAYQVVSKELAMVSEVLTKVTEAMITVQRQQTVISN